MANGTTGGDSEWDEAADLVIAGSGGGAFCAALVARDHGLVPLIVEKQERVGGSTGYSGGVAWVPNNPLMAAVGVDDSCERARRYLDATVRHQGAATSPARREAFLRSGPEAIAYLMRKGMRFRYARGWADYHDDLDGGQTQGRSLVAERFDLNRLGEWKDRLSVLPGDPIRLDMDRLSTLILVKRTWRARWLALRFGLRLLFERLAGKDVRGAGAAWQGRLLQIALDAGIVPRTGTAVRRLIVEAGRVVGVEAERDGRRVRIRARHGVLLNSGGFSHNQAMRQQYGRPPASTQWTSANPGDTGELMQGAMALGAAVDCMDEAIWGVTSVIAGGGGADDAPKTFGHHFDISYPHVLLVDGNGERFANEAGSYMELGQRLYRRIAESGKGLPFWAIIESRHRERYLWGMHLGRTPRHWFDSGYMKRADTIEDLARQCGLDPLQLRRTVERFNGFCRTGVDLDFGKGGKGFDRCHGDPTVKPNPNLGAIEKPPFYAVALYPGDVGTIGGLVTDEHARVLDAAGDAIPGLYAAGNVAAPVTGRTYPGAGASIAGALVFGYRAALHAASDADAQEARA